jgi:hypothetical protein
MTDTPGALRGADRIGRSRHSCFHPRSTLNAPNSSADSGTRRVHSMFIGRLPLTSSAGSARYTGPHARYGSPFRARTKSWNVHPLSPPSR